MGYSREPTTSIGGILVLEALVLTTSNLVTLASIVKARQEDLRALLRAEIAAEGGTTRHPEAAIEAVAAMLGMDRKDVTSLWATSGEFRVSLTQTFLLQLEAEARWASAKGLAGTYPPSS